MLMVEDDRGDSFLTVAEVAEWLKLNQQTVRNWIDQGSLPAVRVGRRVRIKRSDLDRILDQGYQGGGQGPREPGPSADDFWGGQPVGIAEVDPVNGTEVDPVNGTEVDPVNGTEVDPVNGPEVDPVNGPEVDPINGSELADGSAGRDAGSDGGAEVPLQETSEPAD
jgi:excisionase family DNA binding protein